MSDLAAAALNTNAANMALGNEEFGLACARFVRNRNTPSIYDANHVSHIGASTAGEIEELFAVLEREYEHTKHRRFDVDYRTPPQFVARLLLDGGYTRDDALCLLLVGELIGAAPEHDIRPVVSEADWEAYWELMFLDWREGQEKRGRPVEEHVARQMWESHGRKQPPVQNWMAYVKERPAAYFNSWHGVGGLGQVEDLFTHPEFRRRGIATALIHHCVRDSRAKGAGPVLIVADPDDTPKYMYRAMGFQPVAVASHYLKKLGD